MTGPIDVERGVEIRSAVTAKVLHSMLVREGCDGSPDCALEIHAARGPDWLGNNGINLHLNDDEAEQLFQAIKAVRKQRRARRWPPG